MTEGLTPTENFLAHCVGVLLVLLTLGVAATVLIWALNLLFHVGLTYSFWEYVAACAVLILVWAS